MSEQSINVQLDNNNPNHQPHTHATNDLTTTDQHQSFEKYIDEMKKLYFAILDFLESSDENYNDILNTESFQSLIKVVHDLQIDNDQEGIQQFLQMINDISDNHCRNYDFNKKVNQLLLHYKNQIEQTLSNHDIYQIFRNNKILLLFLLQNQIITITQPIYDDIITKIESN